MTTNISNVVNKKTIKAILALSFALFLFFFPAGIHKEEKQQTKTAQQDVFTELEFEAKAIYVYDIVEDKILFEFNKNKPLPLASLTKIMTVLTAKTIIPEQFIVTISKEAIEQEGDDNLLVGEKWRLFDLLDFIIVKSSNDAAAAVALSINGFVKKMNEQADIIGMKQTYFFNETGLDISDSVAGAYGSAQDMAKLMIYALKNNPEIFEATKYDRFYLSSFNKKYYVKNSNSTVASSTGIIASKTGFTDLAGGNLAIIFDAGFMRPVVAVVLGSTYDGRFTDMQKLIFTTLEKLAQ